ncbi:MAG TPA: acetamidase/formamidase family protein [Bryobacteraceae bacterium]|nr:acetamidase/formamidase family protein [Bryobacteraceae bacterium]
MRINIILLFLLPLLAVGAGINGTWHLIVQRGDEPLHARVDFTTDGKRLTGSAFAGTERELRFSGEFADGAVLFNAAYRNGGNAGTYSGRVDGDHITGTFRKGDDAFAWTARRLNTADGPAQTHVFDPVQFHRFFASTIAPALRIQPGDTIRTWTVDSSGRDAKGTARSPAGNPQTGPFYVENALPGDTLAITFRRVRLNRDTARSGVWLGPSTVRPLYFRDTKYDPSFRGEWKLDRDQGYALLANPTPRLKNFRVKTRPIVGCVAVAPPPGESFPTYWPGSFGGNMDYNGLQEGVTVYLPVYVPGALLFVGDGHAAQGDGELNGDALETSLDLEFTVNVVRGQGISGPRMENAEWVMASGISNSLNEALQAATTSLARWVAHEYKLNPNETAIVLGTSVRFDVAEVVDPLVHIVAKLHKDVLATLKE